MSNLPSKWQIVEAILRGIENAEQTYERWSNGNILSSSAEHVIYVFIAEAIWKIQRSKFLRIEQSCKDIIHLACENRRGRLANAARHKGHVDIVLSWANDKPRAIIEIKSNVYNYEGQCRSDIQRIVSLLNMHDTTLQFGIFAFYASETNGRMTAKEKLEKRYDFVVTRIKEDYKSSFEIYGDKIIKEYTNWENNTSAWSASCILLEPRK